MPEMKKQYLLKIRFVGDDRWWPGAGFDPLMPPHRRYYNSLEEVKAGLNRITGRFNKEHVYNENGQRRECAGCGGGFAADIIIDKKHDAMHRVVSWSIQEREVTPWEIVEHVDLPEKEEN